MKKIISFLCVLAVLASCQQPTSKWSTMKVIQDRPQLSVVNLRDTAADHGDGLAFEAILRDTTGKQVGEVHGWLVTVDLSDSSEAGIVTTVDKIGNAVFNIDGEDIVVYGETSYSQGKHVMNSNSKPQRRAILGGTGKFRGITGEIQTTRNEDSTYLHEFIYKSIE